MHHLWCQELCLHLALKRCLKDSYIVYAGYGVELMYYEWSVSDCKGWLTVTPVFVGLNLQTKLFIVSHHAAAHCTSIIYSAELLIHYEHIHMSGWTVYKLSAASNLKLEQLEVICVYNKAGLKKYNVLSELLWCLNLMLMLILRKCHYS